MSSQNNSHKFFPFLSWWPSVNGKSLRADFLAGLTGAVIVLPQGVAFAMIAGLPPIYGLYTAIITPVIAALFGSSHHLVSGPTTAISIVVFSAISPLAEPGSETFIALTLILTLMAGVMQLALGLARLGALVNFVSNTVIVGFTAGAAILIATKQLKYVFGLKVPAGSKFYTTILEIASNIEATNWRIVLVAASTLLIALASRWISKKLPFMLIAMIAGSFISYLLGGAAAGIPLVGEIDFGFPEFGFPLVDWGMVQQLAPNAFAVTLLGLISSVAIAKAIAAKTGQRVDSSLEFIGQGLSNIVGGLFNCYAGSGSFTRSGINHESGAKTPLSVIFASGLLLIILLFVAPWTAFLPIPAMAGIIMLVAYYLIDFKYIRWILKVSGMESSVLIITFLATLFLNLEFAIYLGVIVSLILFLLKTSHPRVVPMGVLEDAIGKNLVSAIRMKNAVAIDNMEIIRIDGSLFFGSVDHVLQEIQEHTDKGTKYILIDGSAINNVDMQGVEMLVLVSDQLRKMGGGLYIYDLKRPVREYLTRGDYWKRIGPNNIFDSPWRAIHQAQMDMDSSAALSENGA